MNAETKRLEIVRMIHKLSQLLPRQMTEELNQEYCHCLMAYDLNTIAQAMTKIRDQEKRFPTIAVMLEYLNASRPRIESPIPVSDWDRMTPNEKQRAFWAKKFYCAAFQAWSRSCDNLPRDKWPMYRSPSLSEFEAFVKRNWNGAEYLDSLKPQKEKDTEVRQVGQPESIGGILNRVMNNTQEPAR
jgi:hypothetical protein